jgi:glyoxylase-like metal-dependent hydrolase (beta-lactamase superfamily II)
MNKRAKTLAALLAAGIAAWATLAQAQQDQNFDNVQVHALHVNKNVYVLVGAGGNITLQVGPEGVLLVDTMFDPLASKIMAEVRKLSSLPVRFIINTSADADHTGGNEVLAVSGARSASQRVIGAAGVATIIAHEKVLTRMVNPLPGEPAVRGDAWPSAAYYEESKDLYFNGEPVEIYYQPAAHTDGDSIVHFRYSDVISAGEVFSTQTYPVINLRKGGSIQGILDALNHIIDIAVPEDKEEGGTMVIPGHGRLCDEADVVDYRNMVTIVRDRIADSIGKGMTLEQVQAARPTRDYDRRWGTSPAWTPAMFIEAVYKTLAVKK